MSFRLKGFRFVARFLLAGFLLAGVSAPLLAQEPHHHAAPVQQAPASAGEGSEPDNAVPAKKEEVRDENDEYRHSATVQALGRMLGLSTEKAATAFTLFNFFVLVIGIAYLLLKLLPKTFRNRSTAIQKQLVDARTATEEATARLNSVEARLSKLDEQIAAMHTQAEADGAREEQRLKAALEDEKAKILAAADAEIYSATALARREIQQYAAQLAIEQAARKLVVTPETDRMLVENFAQRLGASFDAQSGSKN